MLEWYHHATTHDHGGNATWLLGFVTHLHGGQRKSDVFTFDRGLARGGSRLQE
jgi:hypothetical protein